MLQNCIIMLITVYLPVPYDENARIYIFIHKFHFWHTVENVCTYIPDSIMVGYNRYTGEQLIVEVDWTCRDENLNLDPSAKCLFIYCFYSGFKRSIIIFFYFTINTQVCFKWKHIFFVF